MGDPRNRTSPELTMAVGLNRLETELGLFRIIASQIAESREVDSALAVTVRELCEACSWPLGQVWIPRLTDAGEVLELSPVWCATDAAGEQIHQASGAYVFTRGQEIPGRAWAQGSALWVIDPGGDPTLPRGAISRQLGLQAVLALPIVNDNELIAILEFFLRSRSGADEVFAEVANALAIHVGILSRRIGAESKLRRSEERFASFMRNLPGAAFIRDAQGRYLFVNGFMERTTGRAAKDWIGKSDADLAVDHPNIVETDRAVVEKQAPLVRTLETRRGSEKKYWLATKFPLPGDDLSPHMVGGISLEVTQQKMAEDSMRESEQRLRLLIESVTDYAIFTLDPDGNVTSWNPGAERLKGYKADEIIGRHFSAFYPAEDVAAGKPQKELEIAAAEGRAGDEGWRVTKDGSRFWASVAISAIRDQSGVLRGFAKVTRDLTERKRSEDSRVLLAQTQEALRVRDEILSFASHEMRSPLASLQLQLELLRRADEMPPARLKEIVARVARAYVRMNELVESFLERSRVQGRIVLKPEEIDLNALASAVTEEFRQEAQRKKTRLVLTTAPERCTARTDAGLLRLILGNLIGNAIKFNGSGDIEVTVSCDREEQRISVRDHGPGIAVSDQGRIFEPFERIEKPSHKYVPGVGLGLALVRRMSEAIGARIDLESEVGIGSTFTVVIQQHGN